MCRLSKQSMSNASRQGCIPGSMFLRVALILLCMCYSWGSASADAKSESIPVGELSKLVETLEDDAARAQFVNNLKLLLAAQRAMAPGVATSPEETAGPVLSAIVGKVAALGSQFAALAKIIGDPRQTGKWFVDQIETPRLRGLWIELAIQLAIVVVVGFVVAWLVRLVLSRPRTALEEREAPPLRIRIPLLFARTLLDLLPVAAFAVAAFVTVALVDPSPAARIALLAVVNAVLVSRGVVVAVRMLFTPLVPSLRLIDVSNQTAAYAFVWLRRLVNVPVYGYFLLQAALALGLPHGGYAGLLKLIGLIEAILVVVLILQIRETVATAIRPETASDSHAARAVDGLRRRIAEVWHILCALYVAGVYLVWALDVTDGFSFIARATAATVVIVLVARLVQSVTHRLVARMFRVSGELRQRYPQIEHRANRYLPLISQLLAGVIYAIAGLLIFQAWRIDILAWLFSEAGNIVIARAFSIALILLVALAVWEAASLLISIYLERADSDDSPVTASARVRTLLPLARNALLVVILAIVTLTVLAELGVNIGPLLAGAGVAGLAIGFGAQTLVKDVITGAFILFEDQIAVDDVISVGGDTGVVEGITIRTISLRDLHGRVHIVPFSAVTDVTNYTKEYSYAVIDAGVAYRENTDDVTTLLEEVGAELREDPEFASDLPEPLQVFGVQELADSAVVIRVRFKTTAGKQWAVSREFNRRMKIKFDANGVEIPFPHQAIYFGEDKDGWAPPLRVSQHQAAEAKPADRPTPQAPRRSVSSTPDDSDE